MKINNDIINAAAIIGNIFLVEYFIKEYSFPHNILVFSAGSENIELVECVLKQEGIDINAKDYNGYTALIIASRDGYTEIVKLLLVQEGIDINAKDNYGGYTALIIASENGYLEIVKLLLEQEGIEINAKDNYGNYLNYEGQHLF